MKRDMNLVREVLLAVETGNYPKQINDYTADQIQYHAALLINAGLLDGVVEDTLNNASNIPSIVLPNDLTWEGHEFLAATREVSVWETIKSEFKEASFETVVSVGKQLAEGYAKKKVEKLLAIDTSNT